MKRSTQPVQLRTIVTSGATIFVGTAALGLAADMVNQHVRNGHGNGHAQPAGEPPEGEPAEAHGHGHPPAHGHDHAHVRFAHGRISLRHYPGPFGVFVNGLGGLVAGWQGYRLARSGAPNAALQASVGAVAATAVHALGHLALDGERDLKAVVSPCHLRLLTASVVGALVGTGIGRARA
jgi:hypothetical protein